MNDIDTIKTTDIKHIIEHETGLQFKKNGSSFFLEKCPFCNSGTGKNNSSAFNVPTNKNFFKCFSCDAKGSNIDFIAKYRNMDTKQTIDYIKEKYTNLPKFEPPQATPPDTGNKVERMLVRIKKNDIKQATDYLLSRSIEVDKLPPETYFCNPPYKSKGNQYNASIVFVDSKESVINQRFIDSKEFRFHGSYKGKVYDKLFKKESNEVWIQEGIINALSLPEKSHLALFTANNLIDEPEILKPYLEDKIVILCGDNDTAEAKAGQRFNDYYSKFIQKNIRTLEIKICKLPPDTDFNDLLKQSRLNDFILNDSNFEKVKENLSGKNSAVEYSDKGIKIETKGGDYNVADFHIHLKYCLYDKFSDQTDWIIEVVRHGEPPEYIRLTNDEWNSAKELRKALNKKQYLFKGNDNDLIKIKDYLGRTKQAIIVNPLGFNSDSEGYFFSNMVYHKEKLIKPNLHNIADLDGKAYFMPYTDTNKKIIDNALRFIHVEKSNVDIKTWYNLFYGAWDTGKTNHSILPTCFYIASLFRDFIFEQKNCFPIYYMHGISNSGKSNLAKSLTALSGYIQKDVNLKQANTVKSLPRIAAQISNSITWFDEYNTELEKDVKGICQSFFDGAGYTRSTSTNSIETDSIRPQSALILTANDKEKEDYYLTRYIYHSINEKTKTNDQRKSFTKLLTLQDQGLSSVTIEMLKYRQLIISNWFNDSKHIYNKLIEKCNNKNIHSRLLETMTLILTPAYTLIRTGKINLNVHSEQLLEIGKEHIIKLYKLIEQSGGIDDFWNIIQLGIEDRKIANGSYFKINGSLIYIRFEKLYEYYRQAMRDKATDKDTIKQKIITSEYYKDYTTKTRFTNTNPTSAYILDLEKLTDEHNINLS